MGPPKRQHHKSRLGRTPIKVFVADDHPIVREGVKQILAQTADVIVAGESGEPREMLKKLCAGPWDVALLDLSMGGTSALELVRQVKRERPKLPLLAISGHANDPLAVRVLKAGAAGYLTKRSAPDELVQAIRQVHSGGRYVSPSVAEKLVTDLSRRTPLLPHEALSDREFEVLRLLGAGQTIKQIARAFYVSEKTVSTYRHRILKKLQLKTTADLIRYAIEQRLTE